MGLLRRRAPATTGYAPQPTLGDETAARLLAGLERGAWQPVRDLLQTVTDNDREFYVTVVTEVPGWPPWLDDWSAAEPDDALPTLVRGAHGIQWAWEARGDGLATTVEEDTWALFHQRLAQAEADLSRAARSDPADPSPWVYALSSAMGLGLGLEELRSRFNEAVARCPGHRAAHNRLLMGLTKKWGGSHEEMFDFARSTSAKSPEGSPLHTLVAEAHIERWLGFRIDNDREGADRYWAQEAVWKEIGEAARLSVFSPQLRRYRRTLWDFSIFAFCFWRTGQKDLARWLFQNIGTVNSDHPWYYAGDATAIFTRARAECL
jgi:hypothetical protein